MRRIAIGRVATFMKGGGKVGGECFDVFCVREPGALKDGDGEKKVDKI